MKKQRPKLTIPGQIEHMMNRGIAFEYFDRDKAELFLKESNYYFKLKAYEKVFNQNPKDSNKYVNLDFAHLVELSKIDSLLRKEILYLSLDIEHFLKTKLIYDISEDSNEDGYDIVQRYLKTRPEISEDIEEKGKNSSCSDLIKKYKENYAIWHFVEVISFAQFIGFFEFYYGHFENPFSGRLLPVKFLRNAAAHNNCIINHLKEKNDFERNNGVMSRIGKIPGIKSRSLENKMSNKVVHDFVVMLTVHNDVASPHSTATAINRLKTLFEGRMIKDKDIFGKNEVLISSYRFVKKIIDFYSES